MILVIRKGSRQVLPTPHLNQYSQQVQSEAEWDLGVLIQQPSLVEVISYQANVKVATLHPGASLRLGLSLDGELLELEGGNYFIHLTDPSDAGIHSLLPAQLPSGLDIQEIQLAIMVGPESTSTTLLPDFTAIESVWLDLHYRQPCNTVCYTNVPNCSPTDYTAQAESLETIREHMAQLAADGYSSLSFPVNLNRVTLCGGDIIYLLDEELALLEGNYIADQVITIGSSFQTFTIRSNAAATGGGNSGETHLDIPDLFGMELHYYDPNTPLQAPAQYNGNIAWTKWQVRGREAQYYGYRYDELDRLKRATFGEDWRDQGMLVTNKYTVDSHVSDNLGPTIQYDKCGNIEHLRRRGGVGGCKSELGYSWDTVDQLDYSYNGQNQLTSLTDANELAGGIRYNYSEMEYDQNGNLTKLTKDIGKNISQIDYKT